MLRVIILVVLVCLPIIALSQESSLDTNELLNNQIIDTPEVYSTGEYVNTGTIFSEQGFGLTGPNNQYTITQDTTGINNTLTINNSGSTLKYGDIQIIEIFPSSGNCLDEFVVIQSNITYQGFISLYGLGTSSGIITIWVDLQTGSQLLITDNLAGVIPDSKIMLLSSITLTNAGESLKIIISGEVLDDVMYDNLIGVQSLFYTSNSGSTRIFKTNGPGSPATTCNKISPLNLLGGPGFCDIRLTDMNYKGVGVYELSLLVSGSMVSGSDSINRSVNGITQAIVGSNLSLTTNLGANSVDVWLLSGSDRVCNDQFIFATNYDVGIVKEYITSSAGGSCATSSSSNFSPTNNSTANLSNYSGGECGLRFQGSNLIGFFAGVGFNVIATYNGKDLSDSQKTYICIIDMGDGVILNECNPTSYTYKMPGLYTIGINIFVKNSGQELCHSQHMITASPRLLKDMDQPAKDNKQIDITISQSLDSSGVDTISIYSILPNPVGSDMLLEEFVLYNSGEDIIDSSDYILFIGSKKVILTGDIIGKGMKTRTGGRGLKNDGMCIELRTRDGQVVDKLCYDKVKEGQVVSRSSINQYSSTKTNIDKTKRKPLKLNLKEAGVDKKLIDSVKIKRDQTVALTCTEKIALVRSSSKQKYDKLKLARSKDQVKYKVQLDKYKTKELIARNSRYLYEHINDLVLSNLKSQWPEVMEEGGFGEYKGYGQQLENLIRSGYIYTLKDSKNSHYKYTNNVKTFIQQSENKSLFDAIMPHIGDYIQSLEMYDINYKTIHSVERL